MSQETSEQTYEKVRATFGPNAHAYTVSQGHADQGALARLVELVGPQPTDRVLDIGTGAGHTALAFAPAVARVVAFDLTPQMLEEVERNAAAKGLTNIETRQGAAEDLPFEAASFEIVSCRLTTHHFANLAQAVREMVRVLTPGGQLVIADTSVPEDDELDRQINEIEVLRDPSHVRNYRASEWRQFMTSNGLSVTSLQQDYYDEGDLMNFEAWTRRIGTSAPSVARLRELFRGASPRLTEALRIRLDGDEIGFALPRVTIIGRK